MPRAPGARATPRHASLVVLLVFVVACVSCEGVWSSDEPPRTRGQVLHEVPADVVEGPP